MLDLCFQGRQVVLGCVPDRVQVNAEVVVDQLVTHPGDIFPGRLRVSGAHDIRQPLYGLADDDELTDDAVLNECILQKVVLGAAFEVPFDERDALQDVRQVDTVVTILHGTVRLRFPGCDRAREG